MRALLPILVCTLALISGCASTISAVREGPIEGNQGTRSIGAWVDDQGIETVISVNLKKAPGEPFKGSHIVVTSFNGYILLAGQVTSEDLKAQTEQIAREAKKARKVYNELEIAGPTTALVRTGDSWLTTKIKATMTAIEGFPVTRVKVVTENGTVYLMGLVTPREAEWAVSIVKESYGVQKIVKVFEYIR
ncbi:BON domain-containing protein [Sansalvadorimonas sp. 2012CJ34-2]|uniref:BON domain-containing protein n=1 Tax=Parendozoicomonas callyspongiae TaxID=2942213 RepID=A0ABT0PC78_9GAMM|nr:BON domain-containing protein [Sansalvadorimonas sp. 2012CJ34-2]MCL6268985.1 BON domain-containing protein [Sansalvadorimonas sp. 2012CJ34-2]